MCYDAADFAVAIVDFRISTSRGSKVIDATLRFVNKTSQALILGYVDNSGVALDDQGNRYATYYNTGLAGIGIVNGANGDPKFVLQPGGAGDARFELFWRPGAQDPIGSTFELDMNVREINTLVGGQHTLGSEVPLRFQGLTNGTTGAGLASSATSTTTVPGAAAGAGFGVAPSAAANMLAGSPALPPCDANGSQTGALNTVAGTATSVGGQTGANATSNAAAAITNLRAMFRKKKAAQPAAANGVAGPCAPAAAVTTPVAVGQPATIAQPTIASTAPVPNAARTQNVSRAATATSPNVKSASVVSSRPATPAPKPATRATATATQTAASQKQSATAKKAATAANQKKTDTSH